MARRPRSDLPGPCMVLAKSLPADHPRGRVTCRHLDARPPPVPLGIGSQSRRHNMGVNIDHSAHRVSPLLLFASLCVDQDNLGKEVPSCNFYFTNKFDCFLLGVKTSFESVTTAADRATPQGS